MEFGNEIKRDVCPEKYYAKGNLIKDSLPPIIAVVIVAFFSGSLFEGGGVNIVLTIIIESVFIILMLGASCYLTSGMKKRMSETYISVCENGVRGICPLNGYKNKTFELPYGEINDRYFQATEATEQTTNKDEALIYYTDDMFSLTASDDDILFKGKWYINTRKGRTVSLLKGWSF